MCSATLLEIGKQHIDMLTENAAIYRDSNVPKLTDVIRRVIMFNACSASLVTAANLFRTRTCYTVLNANIFRHVLVRDCSDLLKQQ